MGVTCRIVEALDNEWLKVPAIAVGPVPPTLPTPEMFVLVENDDTRLMRIDVYVPEETIQVRSAAVIWSDWLVVGYSNRVFLVSLLSGDVIEVPLTGEGPFDYFSGFWLDTDFMLIATGEGVLRINQDGLTRWRNLHLGLDGVVIESVDANVITGRGNWDPPDGWRSFSVNSSSGAQIA